MDDKWFKESKRRAGVTNAEIAQRLGRDHTAISKIISGQQRMTLEWAKAFAEALKVPLSEVLEKAGVTDNQTTRQLQAGFSDGDAAPWAGPEVENRHLRTVAQAFGERPGVDVWQVQGAAMTQAGLLPGDYILIDASAAGRARPGDVVIAQMYSPTGAKTVLRKWQPPILMPCQGPDSNELPIICDNVNTVIRGVMIASWRLREIA